MSSAETLKPISEPRHARQVIASLIVNLYVTLQVLRSCIINRLIFVSINCGGHADKNIILIVHVTPVMVYRFYLFFFTSN